MSVYGLRRDGKKHFLEERRHGIKNDVMSGGRIKESELRLNF